MKLGRQCAFLFLEQRNLFLFDENVGGVDEVDLSEYFTHWGRVYKKVECLALEINIHNYKTKKKNKIKINWGEFDLNPRLTGFDPFAFHRNGPSQPRQHTEC